MKILIIGGTGTISKGIADAAINKNYSVSVLNRGNASFRNPKGCKVIVGDVEKLDELERILKDEYFDIIVDPITYNVEQLRNRFDFYKRHCGLYVFISSVAVIGKGKGIQNEDSEKNPVWNYGINKLKCEEFLKSQSELRFIIQRPAITYGDIRIPIPVSCRKNPYTVIDRIVKDKPLVSFKLSNEDNRKHQLMEVSDYGKYSVALFDTEKSINNDYIICGENKYSWEEAYECLYRNLGKRMNLYQIDRKYFKNINSQLYDDLVYDKDCDNVLYSKDKCIVDTNVKVKEIKIDEGMQRLVNYLNNNYKALPIEEEYNLMTDYLLIHFADKDDNLIKYINSLGKDYRKKVEKWYRRKLYKNSMIFKILRGLKKKIRR